MRGSRGLQDQESVPWVREGQNRTGRVRNIGGVSVDISREYGELMQHEKEQNLVKRVFKGRRIFREGTEQVDQLIVQGRKVSDESVVEETPVREEVEQDW